MLTCKRCWNDDWHLHSFSSTPMVCLHITLIVSRGFAASTRTRDRRRLACRTFAYRHAGRDIWFASIATIFDSSSAFCTVAHDASPWNISRSLRCKSCNAVALRIFVVIFTAKIKSHASLHWHDKGDDKCYYHIKPTRLLSAGC